MIWNKIADFFTIKDSENYCAAIGKMSQIRENISDVLVVIPDVTIAELVFLKDKWQELPTTLGENVRMMGLYISSDLKTVLTELNTNSKIYSHEHVNNYEYIYVLNGSIELEINNRKIYLNENDSYIINKHEPHSIISEFNSNIITSYSTDVSKLNKNNEIIKEFINNLKF